MPLPRLALFHGRLGDSRLAELEACAPAVSTWCWRGEVLRTNGGDEGPSLVQPLPDDVPDDVLADAAARAVGCRGAFEVWGAGDTVEACAAATAAVPAAHLRTRVDGPWRVESVVIGAKRSRHGGDLGARMRHFDHLFGALSGRPIQLRGPAHEVWLLEDRRTREGGGALPGDPPRFHLLLRLPTEVPDTRALVGRLDLRRRAFVSTTSLKADRALLLGNLGLAGAGPGATLLDPYCGSGSLLLAGAALGAVPVGADIDWRMVSDRRWPIQIRPTADRPGRGTEAVRMRDNFDEAGLPGPRALLELDAGAPDAVDRLLGASGGRPYDALVTDPPYGRRAFQRGERAWDGALSFKVDAGTQGESLGRLLDLAVAVLRRGGRLVFLAPVRSPRDARKPTRAELRAWLRAEGAARGLGLVHLGEERVHGGLHRAVVAMVRTP
jgi:tRNA G10  N-methylase Trm11